MRSFARSSNDAPAGTRILLVRESWDVEFLFALIGARSRLSLPRNTIKEIGKTIGPIETILLEQLVEAFAARCDADVIEHADAQRRRVK